MKKKNIENNIGKGLAFAPNGITLISLIITIILILILASIVLSITLSENGVIKVAVEAVKKSNEEVAKEKLELALEDLKAHKYSNENYNENEYIDNYLKNEGMNVNSNIVIADGIAFEIDRQKLIIIGRKQAEVEITSEIKERLGNGIVNILVKIESDTEIESIIFPNEDGTTLILTTEKLTLAKDLKVEAGKEYPVIVKTKDGKTTNEIIKIEPTLSIMASVGDFVNYSAGNWTQEDIAKLGNLYTGASEPTEHCKFGGVGVGTSKDASMNYKKETNLYSSGWRVLKVNTNGTIVIVHAGTTELFRVGNTSLKPNAGTILKSSRDWSMYEDCSTNAVSTNYAIAGTARIFGVNDLKTLSQENNLRRINHSYWLDVNNYGGPGLGQVLSTGKDGYTAYAAKGIRPIVTLKANVKATATEGQATHTTPETAWKLSLDE